MKRKFKVGQRVINRKNKGDKKYRIVGIIDRIVSISQHKFYYEVNWMETFKNNREPEYWCDTNYQHELRDFGYYISPESKESLNKAIEEAKYMIKNNIPFKRIDFSEFADE